MNPLRPFPYRIEAISETIVKSYSERLDVDRKIQEIKDKLKVLIQSNYPVLPSTPFMEPVQRMYMNRYFGGSALGQDWRRNTLIQELLMKLAELEQKQKGIK